MGCVPVWITFTALFGATCYCYTIHSQAKDQQIHLRSHLDESEENFHHAKNNDPSLGLCGYHVCFMFFR